MFMKRSLAAALALLLLLSGCARQGEPNKEPEGLTVYVSIYPLYDFAAKIAGEDATVVLMTAGSAEPHDWEPSPADRAGLETADVFVYAGLGMEHWVDTVLDALENDPVVVAAADAVEPLAAEEQGNEAQDPHTWLSPSNAKAQMAQMAEAFAGADPGHAERYRENLAYYSAQLDELDAEYRRTLEGLPGSEIVVAHRAFGYLCRDYGLEQVAVRGFSPDDEPDPAGMAAIINYARSHDVKVIFFEQSASPQVAETIAREIGARTDVLHPIEALSAQEIADGEDYFSLMRRNLAALAGALA